MARTIVGIAFSALMLLVVTGATSARAADDGWVSLFDGKTLDGWKASENKDSFSIRDGVIVADGPRSHLFYVGPISNAIFTDFELKVDVKTEPGSNGGIFFHTEYQEQGWPRKGFEAQVNNSYKRDRRKTGSLYNMKDIEENLVGDNEWFTEHIIVRGKTITVKVNGKKVVEWTESDSPKPPKNRSGRILESGTFALQAHDPGSTVYYKNIKVRPLPVIDFPLADLHVHLKGGLTLDEAIEMSKKRGVKFGIAQNCGLNFPCRDDEGLRRYLKMLEGKPVYSAMQAEGREWLTMFSPEWMAKFDYIFTDSMTWTDDKGRRMRLWIPREVHVDDEQQFMDMLVSRAVSMLSSEPVDIYVNPTFLPAVIADKYDELWTQERMAKVIAAAVANDVAIEINARYKLPSIKFIKQAKKAGAKFTCGTNNGGRDLGTLEYCKRAIRECGLKEDDFFTPRPAGKKAVDRWIKRR
ncbi:MAG: family 16 glycoside hydrolase [Planctomycetota bacterium]